MFVVLLVRIQSECGKIRARITLSADTFRAVVPSRGENAVWGHDLPVGAFEGDGGHNLGTIS